MSESKYLKAVWDRLGKIGTEGQKYIDTGYLDSAFGGAEARKAVMLQRMGNRRYANDIQNDYRDKSLGIQAGRLALRQDAIDNQDDDWKWGIGLTAATLPISYMQGQQEAGDVDDATDRALTRTKKLRGL